MRLHLRKSTPAASGRTGGSYHMTVQVTGKPIPLITALGGAALAQGASIGVPLPRPGGDAVTLIVPAWPN